MRIYPDSRSDPEYKQSELGILSRAVHKITFEYLMWQICNGYEDGGDQLDFFSDIFNPVRDWVFVGASLMDL